MSPPPPSAPPAVGDAASRPRVPAEPVEPGSATSTAARVTPPPFSTGAARVVAVQDQGDGTDTFARGTNLRLVAIEGNLPAAERTLTAKTGNFSRPLITPKGDRVVYTDRAARGVYVVSWRGGEPRRVADGFGFDVWRDPSGREWVYVGAGDPAADDPVYERVDRVDLDAADNREHVWDLTPVGEDNVQVSGDGRKASGMFPWPMCGIADFRSRSLLRAGPGCWPSIAPDTSYRLWIFHDDHRALTMIGGGRRDVVDISGAPGVDGREVYHPRWSNHPRYFVVTGPYAAGERGNRIRAGGAGVEVYIGRFDETFTRVEAWERVTRNGRAEFFPDAWIAGAE